MRNSNEAAVAHHPLRTATHTLYARVRHPSHQALMTALHASALRRPFPYEGLAIQPAEARHQRRGKVHRIPNISMKRTARWERAVTLALSSVHSGGTVPLDNAM
ncbi:hypothetical protein EON66_11365 [archaeon]|nr:MAG: hypothetical protein EON66_11365 [archaeon]